MATVNSNSQCVNIVGRLTQLGRMYLVNGDGNDADLINTGITISSFAFGDSDINYNISNKYSKGNTPEITGDNENCIKSISSIILIPTIPYTPNLPGPTAVILGSEQGLVGQAPIDDTIERVLIFTFQTSEAKISRFSTQDGFIYTLVSEEIITVSPYIIRVISNINELYRITDNQGLSSNIIPG